MNAARMKTMAWSAAVIMALAASACVDSKRQSLLLEVDQPVDWQVFQRDQWTSGIIRVSGRLRSRQVGMAVIRILVLRPGKGPIRGFVRQAQTLALRESVTPFSLNLRIPAGGWYGMAISATASFGAKAGWHVRHVGVGEVFIAAGQSNSANGGWPPMRPHEDRVSSFDSRRRIWRWAEDPQTPADGAGGSPWPALGDLLV